MAGVIRHAKKQKNTVGNKEKNESIETDTTDTDVRISKQDH